VGEFREREILNRRKAVINTMKAHKCMKCENTTNQKDGICVICRLGITQMHTELVDLMKKKKKLHLHTKT
jgi:hypothetical protein